MHDQCCTHTIHTNTHLGIVPQCDAGVHETCQQTSAFEERVVRDHMLEEGELSQESRGGGEDHAISHFNDFIHTYMHTNTSHTLQLEPSYTVWVVPHSKWVREHLTWRKGLRRSPSRWREN